MSAKSTILIPDEFKEAQARANTALIAEELAERFINEVCGWASATFSKLLPKEQAAWVTDTEKQAELGRWLASHGWDVKLDAKTRMAYIKHKGKVKARFKGILKK